MNIFLNKHVAEESLMKIAWETHFIKYGLISITTQCHFLQRQMVKCRAVLYGVKFFFFFGLVFLDQDLKGDIWLHMCIITCIFMYSYEHAAVK